MSFHLLTRMGSGVFLLFFLFRLNFLIFKGIKFSQMFSHFFRIYILKISKFLLLSQCEKLITTKKKKHWLFMHQLFLFNKQI
jgi:hypothetical protein